MNVVILLSLCRGLLDSLLSEILLLSEKFVFRWEIVRWREESVFVSELLLGWSFKHTPPKFIKGIFTHPVHGRDVVCMQTVQIGRTLNSCQICRHMVLHIKVARFVRKDEWRLRSSRLTFSDMSLMRGRIYYFSRKDTCLLRVSIYFSPRQIKSNYWIDNLCSSNSRRIYAKFCKIESTDRNRDSSPFRTEGNFAQHSWLALMIEIRLVRRVLIKTRITTSC